MARRADIGGDHAVDDRTGCPRPQSTAALAAVLARDNAPKVWLMHEWLDRGRAWGSSSWHDSGMDVQLTAYAVRDWRANFFLSGPRTQSLAVLRGSRRRGGRCSGRRRKC
jgi:hypothetical protein